MLIARKFLVNDKWNLWIMPRFLLTSDDASSNIPDSHNYFIACLNYQLIGSDLPIADLLASSGINESEIQETVLALILGNWNKNQEEALCLDRRQFLMTLFLQDSE